MSHEPTSPEENSSGPDTTAAGQAAEGSNGTELPSFDADTKSSSGRGEVDISMLLDVPVTLSVEIGRTRVPIRKLLSFSQGSIVELDRDISAPLDLMVNGMLIARGEVVESQGKFGLRLVSVVSASERLKILR